MANRLPIPTPGDKIPNFFLPDAQGTRRQFQGETNGNPILLAAVPSLASGQGAALATAIEAARPQLDALPVQVMLVCGEAPDKLTGAAQSRSLPPLTFSDENSGLLEFLLKGAPQGAAAAVYALDPNQRVLDILAGDPADSQLERAQALIKGWLAGRGEPQRLQAGAPVLVLPGIFSPAFCERLMALWEREHHEGGVSDAQRNLRDTRKKKTLEHVIADPELNREIAQTLGRRVGPELGKAFVYTAPVAFESFVVMAYSDDRSDFFGIHRDRYLPDHPRRFALSLNLNDAFEGGELRFPEYGPHLYRPPAGGAAIFSCSLLHEALPVRRGRRFVMTAFFNASQPQGQAKTS